MTIYALPFLLFSTLATATFSNLNLRILPLGASITTGEGSVLAGSNGYRLDLVLELAGNMVSMLGSRREGYMPDDYDDGYSGYTINATKQTAIPTYKQKPNVVLIHAGTNDLDSSNPRDIADAPKNLGALIQAVIDRCPDVLVLVAQIVPRKDPVKDKLTLDFNNAIPAVVKAFTDQKKHVMAVDMYKAVSVAGLSLDGKHPSVTGYQKMADAWYKALDQANKMGWIKSAPAQDRLGTCETQPIWTTQPGEIFQEYNPGQNLWPGTICKDDPKAPKTCICAYGTGASTGIESIPLSGPSCTNMSIPTTPAVRFADLNGDGRADYVWLAQDGATTAYLNQRLPDPDPAYHNVPNPKNASLHWLPQGLVGPAVGGRREQIHFADLNGDGRAEYITVHPNGSVSAWLNAGSNDAYGPAAAKVAWRAQGLVFNGFGNDGAGVRFADLNGDGLPEYLHLDANGDLYVFLNQGGLRDGSSMRWNDSGIVASNPSVDRANVIFADVNGDGRADLIEVSKKSGSVRARMNLGVSDKEANRGRVGWGDWIELVAKNVTGEGGVQFADLNGDGRAELVEVGQEDSSVRGWVNGCLRERVLE